MFMSRTYIYSRSNNFARKSVNLSRKLKIAFGISLILMVFYLVSNDIEPVIQSIEVDMTSRVIPTLQENPLAE